MTSVVQSIGDRAIGTVEEVSADRITVLLDPDAPQATALNTGRPTGFPRINNYVLIPNEGGATACVISSVRIQRLSFPMRKGMQKDFGLIDLPLGAALLRRRFPPPVHRRFRSRTLPLRCGLRGDSALDSAPARLFTSRQPDLIPAPGAPRCVLSGVPLDIRAAFWYGVVG